MMNIAIYPKIFVLFFLSLTAVFAQRADNTVSIELGPADFPIERLYTVSVIVPNTETRPVIAFPDIPGMTKRGLATSVRSSEATGKEVFSQVITQTYVATKPGYFRLLPFSVTVGNQTARSDGAVLLARPPALAPALIAPASVSVTPVPLRAAPGEAFLSLSADRTAVYVREGLLLKLSFFVAENYPFELQFDRLEQQVQRITEQLRPDNSLQENANIRELQPYPITINGRKFTEYRLYQATIFPLSARPLRLPAVALRMVRVPPVANAGKTARTASVAVPLRREPAVFSSQPVTVLVRPLPAHPQQAQVSVGNYRLTETLEATRPMVNRSLRYDVRIEGTGHIGTIRPIEILPTSALTVYPPEIQTTIDRTTGRVSGDKTFRYFLVPRQNGTFAFSSVFRWVYFDPQRGQYDTLHPALNLTVVGTAATLTANTNPMLTDSTRSTAAGQAVNEPSIYAGIDRMDSRRQPLNVAVLIRAVANVLIGLMLLGVVWLLFRK